MLIKPQESIWVGDYFFPLPRITLLEPTKSNHRELPEKNFLTTVVTFQRREKDVERMWERKKSRANHQYMLGHGS